MLAAAVAPLRADEASAAAALKSKGAEITETKGVITGVSFRDCSKFTAEDFSLLSQLSHLKQVSLGMGSNDETIKALGSLPGLENLGTNGLDATDEGIRMLTRFKKLKSLSFFHPGKNFSGVTLGSLAELPALESLTVGGSMKFGDKAMEAVATLKGLKGFRTWHTAVTHEGQKQLKALKNLTSLTLGHDLNPALQAELTDDTLTMLASMTSLESLTLMEARLSLNALARLKELPKLKSLNLDGVIISESDLEALKQQLPKVNVRWNKPSDAIRQRIEALGSKSAR